MIDGFKKDLIEEVQPIANSWIESSYFKEIYSYVNAPNIDIKTRRESLTSYMEIFFTEILSNKENLSKENITNLYLQIKTLVSAYDQITKRYDLMLKVSKNMDQYFV